jgi:sigma-B regulation protein RsbU (phosphoserine phosphatase)
MDLKGSSAMAQEAAAQPKMRDLEAENQRLRHAVEELSVLNEVASAVSSASSLDAVIDLIVQKCVKHLSVEQAAVLLFNDKDSAAALHTMVRRVQTDQNATPYRLNDLLIGWMLKNQAPLMISDLRVDARFRAVVQPDSPLRSLTCVPLRLKGRMVGVLSAFNKKPPDIFSDSDQRLLTIIASQSAQVIENARLYEEEKALQLMQQELRVAHDIQIRLLPAEAPSIPGYEITGATLPASNVGGDYYDFIPCGRTQMAICLGDVSGKGIPAAVLMACVQATIRAQTLLEATASACLERSNQLLHRSTDAGRFVTLFYGILDPDGHRFRYSNAGHNPPILLSSGRGPRLLTAGGPVLGVLPDFRFEEAEVSLDPGDLIVIFSDGFTEAMNLTLEEFGEERLLATLEKNRQRPVKEMVDAMFAAIRQHAGGASQHDDMTIVILRRAQ